MSSSSAAAAASSSSSSAPPKSVFFQHTDVAMDLRLAEGWSCVPSSAVECDDDDEGKLVNCDLICRYIRKSALPITNAITSDDVCSVVVSVSVNKQDDDWNFNEDNFETLAGAKFAAWEKANPDFVPLAEDRGAGERCKHSASNPARKGKTFAIRIGKDPRGPALQREMENINPVLVQGCDERAVRLAIQRLMIECSAKCGIGSHTPASCGVHVKLLAYGCKVGWINAEKPADKKPVASSSSSHKRPSDESDEPTKPPPLKKQMTIKPMAGAAAAAAKKARKARVDEAMEACTHIFTMQGDREEAIEESMADFTGSKKENKRAWDFAEMVYKSAQEAVETFITSEKCMRMVIMTVMMPDSKC